MSSLEPHSQFLKLIFSGDDVTEGSEHFTETVKTKCEAALSQASEIDDIISCAADLINLFVQLNWTGPQDNLDEELNQLIGRGQSTSILSELNKESLDHLSWDGEPAYRLVSYPLLLYTAHLLLEVCDSHLHSNGSPSSLKTHRWRLRCLFIQQRLLSQRSASLWEEISKVMETLQTNVATAQLSELEQCQLNLELGHICLRYSLFERAKEHFTKAQELAKLTFDLTGALGKRTKFQEQDIAQLLLQVTSDLSKEDDKETTLTIPDLPKNLLLKDDTLLEQVRFAEPQSTLSLTPLQQAVLIGHCVQLQRSSPAHRLNLEEYEAYVNYVLSMPQCWAVECNALYLRCKLETRRHRTVERAMTQLEELVNTHSKPSPIAAERLPLVYSLPLPSLWTLKKELAATLVSLGCLQSALELYERLEMWEEMAECLQAVGRTGRAEEVLRQQLAIEETPTLWCLLGDVTKDPSFYTKAWEFSNHRSARAQRSLGLFHLRREHYEESIKNFELSLGINSMQENLWFSLGCAADRLGRKELAIKSYHRCVTLDPDFGEAWSNLASAYLKVRDKVRAYRVYKEALKCSFDNSKIWENLLVVSADVGAFQDTLRAYHRLLDLRGKFTDVEVLGVLVRAVVENVMDINGHPAHKQRQSLGELLGRLSSQTTPSADVWKLCADFHLSSEHPPDHEKAVVELQKAARTSKLEVGWDREIDKLKRVVSLTMDYCQACRGLCSSMDSSKEDSIRSQLSSAKLALQGVLTKASGFGLSSSSEVEQLIGTMKEEKELLLNALTGLNSRSHDK